MITLTSNTNGKDVHIAVAHIVAIYPGTTGSEILTTPGVVYTVKETPQDILSVLMIAEEPGQAVMGS